MIGRGSFSTPDKILPGIYVKRNAKKSNPKKLIRLYAIKNGDNIALKLSSPLDFKYAYDGKGKVSLSHTDGYSLYAINDGKGDVSMGVMNL